MSQKTPLKNFIRGGQIILHENHMMGQVASEVIIASLVVFVFINVMWFYLATNIYDRHLTLSYFEAHGLLFFDSKAKQQLIAPNGKKYLVYSAQIVNSPKIYHVVKKAECAIIKRFKITAISYPILLMIISYGLRKRGKNQSADNYLRGSKFASSKEVKALLIKDDNASDLKIADVPIVKNSERSHFFIHGTTGTGKTQCMGHLLDYIRSKGQRAIIYDKGGIYIKSHYDPKTDIILNPLDQRSPSWYLWDECKDQADFDSLTESFISAPNHITDPFWIDAARTVFASAAYKMSKQSNPTISGLLRHLLCSSLNEITSLLEGTGAEALVSEKIEKTALCIRASIATAVKSLQYITDNESERFSVRDWILDEDEGKGEQNEPKKEYKKTEKLEIVNKIKSDKNNKSNKKNGFLFISSSPDKHSTLRSLITMWLDTAVKTILSLPEDENRRIWMLFDELPTLNRLPCLQNTLALGRKYGACGVIGIQNYAMLQLIYGNSGAESLKDLCNTSIFLRSPSRKISDFAANDLGECELEQTQEGISYGANTIRDGVSVNSYRVKRNILLSSEIMTLDNLEAFLKLAGNYPVCKVKIKYNSRPNIHPEFIPVEFGEEQKEMVKTLENAIQAAPYGIRDILSNIPANPLSKLLASN